MTFDDRRTLILRFLRWVPEHEYHGPLGQALRKIPDDDFNALPDLVDAFLRGSTEGQRLAAQDRLDGLHLDGVIDLLETAGNKYAKKHGDKRTEEALEALRRARARLCEPPGISPTERVVLDAAITWASGTADDSGIVLLDVVNTLLRERDAKEKT